MEIEKKFLLKWIPENLSQYECKEIEQGYLCRNPIVRIRKSNNDYIMTYKSKFGLEEKRGGDTCISNEVEVMLNQEGYEHLKQKVDNHLIKKKRYIIPLSDDLKAELDLFEGQLKGLVFAEVEFASEEQAKQFSPPDWFSEDVSSDQRYSNSYLSTIDKWSNT